MKDDEIVVAQYFGDKGLLISFKSIEEITGESGERYFKRRGKNTVIKDEIYSVYVKTIEDLTTEELQLILWNLWKLSNGIKFPLPEIELNKIEKPDIKAIFAFLKPD